MDSTEPVRVLGVAVTARTWDACRRALREALAGDRAAHVVTYNPEYAIAARRDPSFLRALQDAEVVTADGVGIVLAARLQHAAPPIERITGVALLSELARLSSETGAGLFLLGAGPGIAQRAAAALVAEHPAAAIAGSWADGTPDPSDDAETIRRIAESGASMLAVAYGAPAQIHWIARNQPALAQAGVRIVIGVGGAFDYLAGEAKRPPGIISRLGLEWLYRLIREPWRWRRQTVLPIFALLAVAEAAQTWLPGRTGANIPKQSA